MEHLGFEQIFVNEFANGYMDRTKGIIACVLNKDYVPISRFKEIFEMLGDEIKEGDFDRFVFDKSKLRTFHQPSMKWYFTEWKTEMVEYGVVNHFKVLPELEYFKRAVEAARMPLLKQFPQDMLAKLRIEYFDTLEEAVNAQ